LGPKLPTAGARKLYFGLTLPGGAKPGLPFLGAFGIATVLVGFVQLGATGGEPLNVRGCAAGVSLPLFDIIRYFSRG
jgi:hypothetical protein